MKVIHALFAALLCAAAPVHAAATVGQPAPDFTLNDTAGKPPVGWYTGRFGMHTLAAVIKHGGFLSGTVTPASATAPAALTLRLHDTAGKIVFASTQPTAN